MPLRILELKVADPVMISRNMLHPHLANGKMYVFKCVTPRTLFLSKALEGGLSSEAFVLHRIDFQFKFSDVKVLR